MLGWSNELPRWLHFISAPRLEGFGTFPRGLSCLALTFLVLSLSAHAARASCSFSSSSSSPLYASTMRRCTGFTPRFCTRLLGEGGAAHALNQIGRAAGGERGCQNV